MLTLRFGLFLRRRKAQSFNADNSKSFEVFTTKEVALLKLFAITLIQLIESKLRKFEKKEKIEMIWRKLQNLSLVKLGALNGFLLGSLIQALFVLSQILFAIYYFFGNFIGSWDRTFGTDYPSEGHMHVGEMIKDDFPLLSLPFTLLLIVALSSFFVQKLFAHRIKSTIFLWQIVGLFAAVFYYFYSRTYWIIQQFERECLLPQSLRAECRMFSIFNHLQPIWTELTALLFFIGIFLVFNLLFAFALRRIKSLP